MLIIERLVEMRFLPACFVLGALFLHLGCKSSAPVVFQPSASPSEALFLLDPTEDFPSELTTLQRIRLQLLRRTALQQGLTSLELVRVAKETRSEFPDSCPAAVTLAQMVFLDGSYAESASLAREVLAACPGNRAALLLAARAAEKLGKAAEALEAFAEAGGPIASERMPRLKEIASSQELENLLAALKKNELSNAEASAVFLAKWLPGSVRQLTGALAIAQFRGEQRQELEILRILAVKDPTFANRRRLAQLELSMGDVRSSLRQWEDLALANPEDLEIQAELDRAKFRWQVERLPPSVRQILEKSAINRGDLAALLFWLIPEIRLTPAKNTPIASDIIDHPERQAILRVIGLGVLSVDENLHRFKPDAGVNRKTVLGVLMELLERNRANCTSQGGTVCARAVECSLVESLQKCELNDSVSGNEIVKLIEESLSLIGRRR